MKFCLYEVLDAMRVYQEADGPIDSEALAEFLGQEFNVPVPDEGSFEATFLQFCHEYLG